MPENALLFALISSFALVTPGFAQEAPPQDPPEAAPAPAAEKPWAKGVSETARGQALGLFREGNLRFEQSQYTAALELYSKAIEQWDHPAIRYNMVVSFIHLNDPLSAFGSVARAKEFGAEPLGDDQFKQLLTYEKLLVGRLAKIDLSCNQSGAKVTMDGKDVLSCPGQRVITTTAGEHQVVGTKAGHLTSDERVVLASGKTSKKQVELVPLDEAIKVERRWAAWKPWALTGGAVALSLVGTGVYFLGRSDMDDYGTALAEACPVGCPQDEVPGSVTSRRSRARAEQVAGLSMLTVGLATTAAGVVLLVLNRERRVPVEQPNGPSFSIAPTPGEGFVAGASWNF